MRKFSPVVEFDHCPMRRRVWLREPLVRAAVRRARRRTMARRIFATGILCALAGAGFAPTLHIYTSGSGATETIPGGGSLEIECWGSGGGGGGTTGVICSISAGGGGASGGYSRCTLSIGSQSGKTFTYSVGAVGSAGVQGGANGGGGSASSVAAGTITGFSTITCNGGGGGITGGGAAASGGTVTNANAGATNTTGNNGGGAAPAPGAGITGNVTGDGSPYGGGGNGHNSAGVGNGNPGLTGAVVFSYT